MTETLFVSEIFDSLQGEGPSQGYPCTFLRLAGCNLTCTWCDTDYSWNWSKYDVRSETFTETVEALAERFASSKRLIVTGGEPLLQQKALALLFQRLPTNLPIEIETNGTVVPSQSLQERVDQWNVAPKLSNSGEPACRRLNLEALETFKATRRAWMKLVIESPSELPEANGVVNQVAWPTERVYLMPQCRSPAELANRTPAVVNACLDSGYKFTGRLHLQVWGGERGR